MPQNKFQFVSPGIQINEVDNSRLPKARRSDGPIIIGRAERGPALRPVTIDSFSDFVEIFGNPFAGGVGGDIWRDGNKLAPSYAGYAAQAWCKNQSGLTFVRLLGAEHADRTNGGMAGWQVGSAHDATLSSGGAFGLFLIDSGSSVSALTGTLAAVFYAQEGAIELSGSLRGSPNTIATGTAVFIASQGTDKEFKALVRNSAGNIVDTIVFNFNRNSKKYIRGVFNTNPTLLNSAITNTSQLKTYFLGETFDRAVADSVSGSASGGQYGVILSLTSGSADWNDQRMNMTAARTPWIIAQHLGLSSSYNPADMTRLFRLICLDSGEWEQKNLKVSIEDVKASTNLEDPYGSFTVVVRKADDVDNSKKVIEKFTSCNLNPNSTNFVAKKIGNKFQTWDDTERKFLEFGDFDNQSRYIYVEMNADVFAGATSPELLPFGVLGPTHFRGFTVLSGSQTAQSFGATDSTSSFVQVFAEGANNIVRSYAGSAIFTHVGSIPFTGSFRFPSIPLRSNTRVGNLGNPKDAYFGVETTLSTGQRFEKSYWDLVRKLPDSISEDASAAAQEYMWVFSLDDVGRLGTTDAQWVSGSRVAGTSFTALTGTYTAVLSAGFDKFTVPLYGGFDGVDLLEKEPFANRTLSSQTQLTSYEFNSVKRAIDAISDPEVVEGSILVVPGCTNTGITDHMLNVCEKRGDLLAIVDLEGGYVPSHENTSGDSSVGNRGDVDTTISNLKARAINSSYGTSYYPWEQIRDPETGLLVWVPPSVIMLGVYAYTDKNAELWFAPAGFTRGGLTNGAAGLPVVGVRERLDKKARDKLYAANINPIGRFPAEGIVVMGQKTLQTTPSALDRVNVRRLMIYLKKRVSQIAARLLFEPNLTTTWDRFKGQVEPELRSVKARFGLQDFRVVLDETTTTPDLIDRNTIYAKIFLKPAYAVEFFGIDFVISSSGASFAE